MKREMQRAGRQRSTTSARPKGVGEGSDTEATDPERACHAREEVRQRQPLGAFDARAIRELSLAVPTDPASLRRTIRRNELRQIVPLADSTIYELERRGEFPQRFFLTARCVVWDLAEVEAWLLSRREPAGADVVKKAPVPDFRKRQSRVATENG
jgi:prophage regulatory protein